MRVVFWIMVPRSRCTPTYGVLLLDRIIGAAQTGTRSRGIKTAFCPRPYRWTRSKVPAATSRLNPPVPISANMLLSGSGFLEVGKEALAFAYLDRNLGIVLDTNQVPLLPDLDTS